MTDGAGGRFHHHHHFEILISGILPFLMPANAAFRAQVKEVAIVNLEERPNTLWPCTGFFEDRAFDRWCQNLLSSIK